MKNCATGRIPNTLTLSNRKPAVSESSERKERRFVGDSTEGTNSRILLVDDDKAIRYLLSMAFSRKGHEVVSGGSGHEALSLFLDALFGLVLTDLNMPGMDGWTLASCIKDKAPATPVVLITAEEPRAILERIGGIDVDLVIFKPFCLEDVQNAIHRMLDIRSIIESEV
jgi:CheY-like chemotaxis protein